MMYPATGISYSLSIMSVLITLFLLAKFCRTTSTAQSATPCSSLTSDSSEQGGVSSTT